MDLVQTEHRDRVLEAKTDAIKARSESFMRTVRTYGTSIWDQTLYRAWGNIVHSLIPNLDIIKGYLEHLAEMTEAEEVVLFERTTFLTVTSVTSKVGERNTYSDRYERLSNIIKTFKNSLS
jgi:Ras-related GTP-binding protein A/B